MGERFPKLPLKWLRQKHRGVILAADMGEASPGWSQGAIEKVHRMNLLAAALAKMEGERT